MPTFKVRDFRNKQFFLLDDAYLNGYAKHLDPTATVVYLSLCRHADKNQTSFPSQNLIAEEHNIGRRTVVDKLRLLQDWNIISVERGREEHGKWGHNIYTLLDKSEWKVIPSATDAHGQPSADDNNNQVQMTTSNQVQELHTKDTHIYIKDTHNKGVYTSPHDIKESDLIEIAEKYQVSLGFVKLQYEKLLNYCESKGKVYKNYKATLKNFVLSDMQKEIERPHKGGVLDASNL